MTHFFARSRSIRSFGIAFVASLAALFSASPADARITRIEIDAARSQSPTFGAGTEEARLMQAGITRGVLPPEGGVLPAVEPLRACREDEHEHGHDHDHRDHDDDG
jgi:hypothetical protein